MNGGRIEQLGSPEQIYEQPHSEFVARFIGASNVVKGKSVAEDRIDFAGTPLRCTGARMTAGKARARRHNDPPLRDHHHACQFACRHYP